MGDDNRDRSYSGKESYKLVEPLIKSKSSSLLIVCPFITPAYARMLVNESSKKQVSVITSNSQISAPALRILKKGRTGSFFMKVAIYFLILEVILFFLKFYILELAVLPIIFISLMIAVMQHSSSRKHRVRVKVSEENFIHEKLYITDTTAITGSANLTYAGLHKNIEHIDVTGDRYKIESLKSHFWSLWNGIQG